MSLNNNHIMNFQVIIILLIVIAIIIVIFVSLKKNITIQKRYKHYIFWVTIVGAIIFTCWNKYKAYEESKIVSKLYDYVNYDNEIESGILKTGNNIAVLRKLYGYKNNIDSLDSLAKIRNRAVGISKESIFRLSKTRKLIDERIKLLHSLNKTIIQFNSPISFEEIDNNINVFYISTNRLPYLYIGFCCNKTYLNDRVLAEQVIITNRTDTLFKRTYIYKKQSLVLVPNLFSDKDAEITIGYLYRKDKSYDVINRMIKFKPYGKYK